MSKHSQVIEILETADTAIAELLTDPVDQMHGLRIHHELKKLINYFGVHTSKGVQITDPVADLPPATTSLGEKIDIVDPSTKVEDLKLTDEEKAVLRAEVENADLLVQNADLSSTQVLQTVKQRALRVLGLKYGLQVTAFEPAVITAEFVDEIRAKIASTDGDAEAKAAAEQKRLQEEQAAADQLKKDQDEAEAKAAEEKAAQDKAKQEAADKAAAENAKAAAESKSAKNKGK